MDNDNNHLCRICLGEAYGEQPLHQRCACAEYHDHCFIEYIKHTKKYKCDICNEQFRGLSLTCNEVKIASCRKIINLILGSSLCFLILSWVKYNAIISLNNCITTQFNLDKLTYRCINEVNGIQYFSFAIFINETIFWFMLLFIKSCFGKQIGIDIYKHIYHLSLDTGYSTIISNDQYLQFNTDFHSNLSENNDSSNSDSNSDGDGYDSNNNQNSNNSNNSSNSNNSDNSDYSDNDNVIDEINLDIPQQYQTIRNNTIINV